MRQCNAARIKQQENIRGGMQAAKLQKGPV